MWVFTVTLCHFAVCFEIFHQIKYLIPGRMKEKLSSGQRPQLQLWTDLKSSSHSCPLEASAGLMLLSCGHPRLSSVSCPGEWGWPGEKQDSLSHTPEGCNLISGLPNFSFPHCLSCVWKSSGRSSHHKYGPQLWASFFTSCFSGDLTGLQTLPGPTLASDADSYLNTGIVYYSSCIYSFTRSLGEYIFPSEFQT